MLGLITAPLAFDSFSIGQQQALFASIGYLEYTDNRSGATFFLNREHIERLQRSTMSAPEHATLMHETLTALLCSAGEAFFSDVGGSHWQPDALSKRLALDGRSQHTNPCYIAAAALADTSDALREPSAAPHDTLRRLAKQDARWCKALQEAEEHYPSDPKTLILMLLWEDQWIRYRTSTL